MTNDSPVSRRRVLRTVGIGTAVALAGCSGDGNGLDNEDSDSTESTPKGDNSGNEDSGSTESTPEGDNSDNEDSGSTESTSEGDNGDDADTNNADTSGPEAVVRTYYQRLNDAVQNGASGGEAVEAVSPLIFEGSTFLRRSLRESFEQGRVGRVKDVASVETAVTAENLSVERLNNLGFEGLFSEEEIETIAEENANVEATLEYTGDREPVTEDLHITARIDNDWVIIAVGQ